MNPASCIMTYAIISDIHANLEALNRVLEEIDKLRVDKIICLGDIVGYGASPNECVEIIIEREIDSIIGNHDAAASGKREPYDFNSIARDAVLWTKNALTSRNRDFLMSLPQTKEIEDFLIVHGAISDPDSYIFSSQDAMMEFRLMDKRRLCFFGHTHVRVSHILLDNRIYGSFEHEIEIEPKAKYLINPGSVGQPRDTDPRASFLIYDCEGKALKFIRLDYDIALAQEKIIAAGLDKRLAYRLSAGI